MHAVAWYNYQAMQPNITNEIYRAMSGTVGKIIGMSHASDVPDCVQEACVRALSAIGSFDADKGTFKTWCCTIAMNVARNWRKLSANRAHDSEGHADESGDAPALVDTLMGSDGRNEVIRSEEAKRLAVALDTLTGDDRAFVDALMDGMGQTEAGAILGWSPATATNRRYKIERRLARMVQGDKDD